MRQPFPVQRRQIRPAALLLGFTLLVSLSFAGSPGAWAEEPAGSSGMRMYRDPDTGRTGAPPAGMAVQALPQTEQPAQKNPGGALVSDHNGMKVSLGGRFRAAVQRHAGSAGAQHECIEDKAGADE